MSDALNSEKMVMRGVLHCAMTKRAVNINGIVYSAAHPISSLTPTLFGVEQFVPGIELSIDTIKGSIAVGCPNEIILEAPRSRTAPTQPFSRLPGSLLALHRQGRTSAFKRRHVRGTSVSLF
jgi:hypothetical protein